MKKSISLTIILALCLAAMSFAQETIDWDAVNKIKQIGLNDSEVNDTIMYLTDVNGPRLSNSPGYFAAAKWAVAKMQEWGMEAKMEPYGEWGRGWSVDYFHINVTDPMFIPVIGYPKAWVGSTDGEVKGSPVLIDIKSEADFDKYKGKLKGAIVMTSPMVDLSDKIFEIEAKNHDEESLAALMNTRVASGDPYARYRTPAFRAQRALRAKISNFLREEGVAVLLEASQWDEHNVRVGSGGSSAVDGEDGLPSFVLSAEQYNRIVRMINAGREVKMNVRLDTTFHTDETRGINVIGEIPGTDPELKDEVIILGGHLDSWHAGTGAADNASGAGVAMEAARLIMKSGLQPRRTIRVALWHAEEQGLNGSRGYVKNHFADPTDMKLKPEHEKLSLYLNMDNGVGAFRGIYAQGNAAVMPIFEAWGETVKDLGFSAVTYNNTSGTDHLAFLGVGLPGFQFVQDSVSYSNRNHHASMDVYDQVVESHMIKNSIIMSIFAWHASQRDEMMPRLPLPEAKPNRF